MGALLAGSMQQAWGMDEGYPGGVKPSAPPASPSSSSRELNVNDSNNNLSSMKLAKDDTACLVAQIAALKGENEALKAKIAAQNDSANKRPQWKVTDYGNGNIAIGVRDLK